MKVPYKIIDLCPKVLEKDSICKLSLERVLIMSMDHFISISNKQSENLLREGKKKNGRGVKRSYSENSSGKSRIAEVAERKVEAPKAPSLSAEGARIEAPKAPRGVGRGEGFPSPLGRGLGRGPCPLPRNFSIWSSKWRVLVHSGWHFEERGKQCFDGSGVLNLANCAVLYDYTAHCTVSLFGTATANTNTATVAFAVKLALHVQSSIAVTLP